MEEKEKVSVLTDFPYSKETISVLAVLAAIGVGGGLIHSFVAELEGIVRLKGLLKIIAAIPSFVWWLAAIGGTLALYIPLMNSMKKIVPSVGALWLSFIITYCLAEVLDEVEVLSLILTIAQFVIMIVLGVKIKNSFGGKISTFGLVFWLVPLIGIVIAMILVLVAGNADEISTVSYILFFAAVILGFAEYFPLHMISEFAGSESEETEETEEKAED